MMKRIVLSALLMGTLLFGGCRCDKQQEVAVPTYETVLANILQRKSVRSYTSDTIPSEVMENLLRAAMAAPSGRDWRPWSFVVITDKSRLGEIFEGNFNMPKFEQAAAIVVICADTVVALPPSDNSDMEPTVQVNHLWRDDMGAVTENLLLLAEAYGLGACWTACYPYADRMEPVKRALALPSTVVPYCVVPLGYPAGNEQPKDKWDPSRVHYNLW